MHLSFSRIGSIAALLLGSTVVHGESLVDLYNLALKSDTQIAIAESSLNTVRIRRDQSSSAIKPQINFSANVTEYKTDVTGSGQDDYRNTGYSLTLTQSLLNYDSWNAIDEADAYVAQAEAQYEAEKQNLIIRVATAYFDLLAAEDDLELAKAEKRAIDQQLNQTKQRFEVGLSAITDVHEAQAGYDLAVAQEIAAQSALDNAREAIHEIAGRGIGNIAKLTSEVPLTSPDPADIQSWVDLALQKNLSVIAQQAAMKASSESLDRAKAGHYPTLNLVAGHSYSDSNGSSAFTNRETTSNNIGLQLSVPIYSGGLTSSKIKEATNTHSQAKTTLEQTRRATVRQSRSAYLAVNAGIGQVKARKQAVASAQKALEATQAGFEVGTRTTVDVLNAQRELFRAESGYSRARYDYLLSLLGLKQAVGNLQLADLTSINSLLK